MVVAIEGVQRRSGAATRAADEENIEPAVVVKVDKSAASAGRLIESPDGTLRIALPPGRSPRALAVALLDGDGEGAAFLPLPGHTRLRLESKRRSVLSVRVAGALFGPVRAPKGKATLPVFVPPGTQSGVVRAVDRIGNVREVAIDLETPSLPRIAAVASGNQVVARGELRLAFALAAADGAPAENAQVRAAASRGSVEAPAARGAGLWTARYRAPGAISSPSMSKEILPPARSSCGSRWWPGRLPRSRSISPPPRRAPATS